VKGELMRKKKGFTLVELIAALAILSIGLSGIMLAFSSAVQTRKNEDIKLDTGANAQIISENLREKGKIYVEDVYNSVPIKIGGVDGRSNVYLYIFFNDEEELNNIFEDRHFTLVTSGTGGYSDCVNKNSGNKTFGARLQITDFKGTNEYSLYRVNTTVWSLKVSERPNTELTFYIGS
jgi:prepilin-type N-terminal cleavage/methylation domain-containing protein